MTALYDWCVQSLVASPLALHIAVVLGVVLPACAVAALFLQRAVDVVSGGICRLLPRGGVAKVRKNSEKEPPLDA
ncbi:hypothetical protein H7347_00700 [Corynebacterium sp. zg-331]|uniref:hypothetical protein n=1 Tax=unclassified Corynebacterium TaxID=2624378 RepID=UPI00128CCC72|nr:MULTISPECIES: hypothetical protein [unclassified Corynebacterium]MBC3185112.1 hypothetical protein [Corynebacterium sp. zg-331]MPV51610.1 hypothetical protein [Corynebacterium sp. zg331]